MEIYTINLREKTIIMDIIMYVAPLFYIYFLWVEEMWELRCRKVEAVLAPCLLMTRGHVEGISEARRTSTVTLLMLHGAIVLVIIVI